MPERPCSAYFVARGAASNRRVGFFMKSKYKVESAAIEVANLWRAFNIIDEKLRIDPHDMGLKEACEEIEARREHRTEAAIFESAKSATGALFQLGLAKSFVENPADDDDDRAKIVRLIDSIARYLISSGGKVCDWYPPLLDAVAPMQSAINEAKAAA